MEYRVSAVAWKRSNDSRIKRDPLYLLKGNGSSKYGYMYVNYISKDDVVFVASRNRDLENCKIYYCIKTIVPDCFKKYRLAATNPYTA